MSTFLFSVCAVDRFSSSFNEYRQLTRAYHRALVARAAAATARLRRRRADRPAPVTPLQKRRRLHGHGFQSLQKFLQRRLEMDMASTQELRRRSSAADRDSLESLAPSPSATTTTLEPAADIKRRSSDEGLGDEAEALKLDSDAAAMPPPPVPTGGDCSPTRESRSTSPATRNANRLSLTLPIAPPSSDPSKPTPLYSATSTSVPPTPVDSSAASPSDANEFIIAIAAQERRVLELRQELSQAEAELSSLKKKWSAQEASSRKGARPPPIDTPRSAAPVPGTAEDELNSPRHSVDFDRRRLLLQQQQTTPTQTRRRVLRGGHTRTLSLLSPPKPDSGFAVHEDREREPISLPLPPVERRTAQLTNPNLAKRASWQPAGHRQQASVPGLVEDFRLGLRAFVEDIRQITVGDEPVTGQTPPVRSPASPRPATGGLTRSSTLDLGTVRPGDTARPKVSTAFDSPTSTSSTPTRTRANGEGSLQRTKSERVSSRKSKHFSWTPLTVDALDDHGWSNWDSPASVKSTRWSGSTINSHGADDIQSIPEGREESDEPSKKNNLLDEAPTLAPPKLGEILPSMVNRLSPSNIKRTANNLMDEWEKSLVDPSGMTDKENDSDHFDL